jgi:hypothetical protein
MPSLLAGLSITPRRIWQCFSPHKKEHYAFLKTEELPEFFRTLNTYSGSIVVKLAMRLQVLTGLRPVN